MILNKQLENLLHIISLFLTNLQEVLLHCVCRSVIRNSLQFYVYIFIIKPEDDSSYGRKEPSGFQLMAVW